MHTYARAYGIVPRVPLRILEATVFFISSLLAVKYARYEKRGKKNAMFRVSEI